MTGDELIAALQALPADQRALNVVMPGVDNAGCTELWPVREIEVIALDNRIDRQDHGERVICL